MNETAFADALVDLINAARHDGPEMLAHTATSFDEDTMIETIKQYSYSGEQHLDFTTRRGDIFMVTVTHVREGVLA